MSQVDVVANSPLPGKGIDRDKAPLEVEVLTARDLSRDGAADLLRAFDEQSAPVALDAAAGNPYQPNLLYHGFEASPLQGTAEGVAVYVDGVRLNQPFGDTVDWDIIPSVAIKQVTLESANSLFGLNALGGAVNIALKTGFDFHGAEADAVAGSFGLRQVDGQFGAEKADSAFYAAANVAHEAGWRDLQSSDVGNLYADWGGRTGPNELHVDLRLASSDLNGPGVSPVQLIAADAKAQFTGPNATHNRSATASIRDDWRFNARDSVQGLAYLSAFRQTIANGNAPNDTPCSDDPALLCSESLPSTTTGGALIPAFLGPSPFAYGELDLQKTSTIGYGASLQATSTRSFFGHSNAVTLGGSLDGARTDFAATSLIGGLNPARLFVGPGVVIDEPGGNTPVRLSVKDAYIGIFATDTLDLTPALSMTASVRLNDAQVDLHDRLRDDLNGDHAYLKFNPAIGAAWRATKWMTLYAGISQSNRAPTPAELSCASPQASCSLANFFVGDPDLRQVTSRSLDAGGRGRLRLSPRLSLAYSIDIYRTDLFDDIGFVNSLALGRAYFTNIGTTRRQGADVNLVLRATGWRAFIAYAHTDATYRTGFVEAAGSNPQGGAQDELVVRRGDRLPGIPSEQLKAGVEGDLTSALTVGADVVARTGSPLVGDEANLTPDLPGYALLNLYARWRLSNRLELMGRIENVTNARSYGFGTFSPTSAVYLAQAPGASNPRSLSPGAPAGIFLTVHARF
ncbi:MAG TPA: TonB-dependent receptor [Caulobacteraceae bacterium]|nr:TonB-dependent receptor [Caulobacteraceae bacterium]